jgi:hypothetical protein
MYSKERKRGAGSLEVETVVVKCDATVQAWTQVKVSNCVREIYIHKRFAAGYPFDSVWQRNKRKNGIVIHKITGGALPERCWWWM